MYPANAYTIRFAAGDDAAALRRLAELDSRPALAGHVLIAEDDGVPVAALSLDDGRTVADPFHHTRLPLILLRIRAGAVIAHRRTPSLRERILAATRVAHSAPAHGAA
jgi:hypothetical protein